MNADKYFVFIGVHRRSSAAIRLALALAMLAAASAVDAQPSPLTLWYQKPAVLWTDALPVGNGHMGAMVFGGAAQERIQFNEHTVWTGEPHDYSHKGAAQSLAKIRQLLWAGKQKEAEDLAMQQFMSEPLHQQAYQAFGDLLIEMPGVENPSGYQRSLDLDTGIATTEFTAGGVHYRREVFASHPANAIIVHLTSSKPATVNAPLHCAHSDRHRDHRVYRRWRSLPPRSFRQSSCQRHHCSPHVQQAGHVHRNPEVRSHQLPGRRGDERAGGGLRHPLRRPFRTARPDPDPRRRHQFQELSRRLRRPGATQHCHPRRLT